MNNRTKQPTEPKYRPFLSASALHYLQHLLKHRIDTVILDNAEYAVVTEAYKAIAKCAINASTGSTPAYTPVAPEDRKHSLSINAGNVAAMLGIEKEISDSDKLAALSPEQQEEFWKDEQQRLMDSLSKPPI